MDSLGRAASRIHGRCEIAFERWARLVLRRPRSTLALTALLLAVCAAGIPRIRVDNTMEGLLHPSDPARVLYDRFRVTFGQDQALAVAVETRDVFALSSLERLQELHAALARDVPHVGQVTSLVNARSIRGDEDRLVVEGFLDEWPRTPAEAEAARARAGASPLYRGALVSDDATLAVVWVRPAADPLAGGDTGEAGGERRLLTTGQTEALIRSVDAVAERFDAPDFRLHVTGGSVLNSRINAAMHRDLIVFGSLVIAVAVLLFWLVFGRLSAVLLPLAVVLATEVATFGMTGLLGIPVSVIGEMLPALLLAVGVADSIHILAILYRRLAQGDGKGESIAFAMRHSGLATLLTTLTTCAGLVAFLGAELAPVSNLGLVAPIGVLLAWVFTVVLLPALAALSPLRERRPADLPPERRRIERGLVRLGAFATGRPGAVALAAAALLLGSGIGAASLRFSHDAVEWFPEDHPFRVATELVERKLGSATTVEALVDTGERRGLEDPEALRRIEAAARAAESDWGPLAATRTVSIVDLVKEINRALHGNEPSAYAIPRSRGLIAQELLLFGGSGSDALAALADSRLQTARVTLRIPWIDGSRFPAFLSDLRERFESELPPGFSVQFTGMAPLLGVTLEGVARTMTRSYLVAFVLITPMMILLIGRLRLGLLSMIPNLLPVVVVIGAMGWLEFPVNVSTLLLGSIILGLAVDNTIHFVHKYERYLQECGDPRRAVRETLVTTGSALFATSLLLTAGFATVATAQMRNVAEFGILGALSAIVAFFADVLVMPALLILLPAPSAPGKPAPARSPSPPALSCREALPSRSGRSGQKGGCG